MRFNIISLACLILLSAPVRAQQGDDVSMKIDVVAWGDEIKGLSLKPGAAKDDISALGFRYSKPVAYTGPVIMEIYQSATEGPATEIPVNSKASSIPITRSTPTPASGATVEKTDPAAKSAGKKSLALELAERRQKEPTLVALAVLPGGACRRATVFLAAAADNTFTAYVINDDPTKLPVGQVRIHNLCPFPIAMRCNGGKVHEIKFKDAILVPAKKDHLVYELAYLDGEKWRMQENNVIPVHPQEQSQMLILKSDNSFFLGNDGSRSGFLQIVTLCRSPDAR